jgi:hypothetical protein
VKASPAFLTGPPVIEQMRSPVLSASVRKEIRALLPVWMATVALPLLIVWQWRGHAVALGWALAVSVLGWVIMAALSVGHEFGHRTVTLLLVQPVPRVWLWRRKRIVLACALATTFATTLWAGWRWGYRYHRLMQEMADPRFLVTFFGAVAVCAFFTTPWLTMLSRHTLGGTVFSLALPVLLWTTASLCSSLWLRLTGIELTNESAFAEAIWWLVLAGCGLVGWRFGRRKFLNLEAVDGRGIEIGWPRWIEAAMRKAVPRRRAEVGGWFGSLVQKELRLQQLPLGLCALFCVTWLLQMAANRIQPCVGVENLTFQGMAFAVLVALLAGALACAEERNAGTLEWHLTLPVSAWKQWLIKCGVALGLAVVMGGILVPATMMATNQLGMLFSHKGMLLSQSDRLADALLLGWMIFWFATVSLHASSMCHSTATAVLIALVGAMFWMWAGTGLGMFTGEKTGPGATRILLDLSSSLGLGAWIHPRASWRHGFPVWAFVLPALLNVPLAYFNFRQVSPSWGRYVAQALGLGLLYFAAGWVYGSLQYAGR